MSDRQLNIFSIDVEEWHHRIAFQSAIREKGLTTPDSALKGSRLILDLLKKHNASATFFVLGEVAQTNPELLEMIVDEGHEVASHGYDHRDLPRLDKEQFAADMEKTAQAIRAVTKEKPKGFRAPRFSLNRSTSWALEVLKEQSYSYDSSIFPAYTPFYGVKDALMRPYRISAEDPVREDESSSLYEFPLLVRNMKFMQMPVKLRHMGPGFMAGSIKALNRKGHPATVLIHPWEVIPAPVSTRDLNIPAGKRWFRDLNIPCVKALEKVMKRFRFTSIRELLNGM